MAEGADSSGIWGPIGGLASWGMNSASSKLAWSRTKRLAQNKYTWAAKDLQQAGLNRVLAIKQPQAGGGVVSPQAPANLDLNKAVSNVQAAKRLNADLGAINSQADLNKALKQKAITDSAHSAASATRELAQAEAISLSLPGLSNAAAFEREFGVMKHRIDWGTKQVGNVLGNFGLLFGLGRNKTRGAPTKSTPTPNKPGHGRVRNTDKAPYVGPRNTQEGSRPWRSSAPKKRK